MHLSNRSAKTRKWSLGKLTEDPRPILSLLKRSAMSRTNRKKIKPLHRVSGHRMLASPCGTNQVEQHEFEMTWRMAKVAGGIDATVRVLETVIHVLPAFKFQSTAGKETAIRDLAGLARSLQAATTVRQGAPIDESNVRSLENRLAAIHSDTNAMLAQLTKTAPS